MRRLGLSLYFALFLLLSIDFSVEAGAVSGFTETTVVGGLTGPTAIAFLPDGRMLVAEEEVPEGEGRLSLVSGGTAVPLVSLPVASICGEFFEYEVGLLGIAVDPNFAANGHIYLYRTTPGFYHCIGGNIDSVDRFNEVVRVTMGPDDTIDLGSLVVLLTGIRTDTGNHCGGCLRIGPDKKLYVGIGETGTGDFLNGGPGTSTNPYSQDLDALEGKILRINLDGSSPDDNPFHGQSRTRDEIFAYGFRNPWRFGFDPETGLIWVGDVGEEDVEEIDIVEKGGNYGWPHCEGNLPQGCKGPGDVGPVYTYPHGGHDASVTGGAFAGRSFGSFAGDYFFGDYSHNVIQRLRPNGARNGVSGSPSDFVTNADGPVDIIFGPDGALYYVAIRAGEVRRVAGAEAPVSGGKQPLSGKKLVMGGGPKKALTVLSKDSIGLGGSADDPTNPSNGGGSLRIVIGTELDTTYNLPSSNWSFIGKPGKVKGYKYKDKALANGPISQVVIKSGKQLKIVGKGSALAYEIGESNPDPVQLVFTMGMREFCLNFGGQTELKANKKFTAKNAPAPADCP